MIYNDAEQSFEITARTKTNIKTGIQFSTQDIDTARLIFTLTKDGVRLPLSAVTGKLVMFMADGSRFIRNVEITDKVEGVTQYVLTSDEVRHYGEVSAELNLYYANSQSLSVHKFSFTIDKALIDTDIVPIAEYYIDDFEALREKINELYDEAIQTIEELRKKFEDLENIETKDGAQAKADKALTDGKAYTDAHSSRTDNPHAVTKDQIGLGSVENVKQASYSQFIAHDSNSVRHTSQAEKDKLNAAQLFKLTQDSGSAQYLTGNDFNTVTNTGFYYMSGATTDLNAPVNNNGYLLVHNYSTYAYQEYTTYSSSDSTSSGRRKFMRNKIASSESWTSWREFESAEGAQAKVDKALNDSKTYTDTKVGQLTSTWTNLVLINGAVTDTAAPLRYRTKNGGDEIQLNGGFKSAFNTIIATGLPKIKNPIEFLAATVGTYGYLRMDYRTNGDLYLAGGTVNSETGLSKISVNTTIPAS
ncbi:BppU family phage baseplate upper protein [Bacillus atrophaeus]|uniref:BppU family phage baseplate upper protein n=1 Tax=Bacillus atrophaeus TaxID=1452 RepID=UPI002E1B2CE2|nr:BppU family phage baseplate upper protein [Bacillus atrophaeus]